jgi:deferrochelatase/peroxidase EfeB
MRAGKSPRAAAPPPLAEYLPQIQGLVLRGYSHPFVRYFALCVRPEAVGEARAFLTKISGGVTGPFPQITSAVDWGVPRPSSTLNLAFTMNGLKNIGVPPSTLASFNQQQLDHLPFINGSVNDAENAGDVSSSFSSWNAPPWRIDDSMFDVLLIVYGDTPEVIEAQSAVLRGLFKAGFTELQHENLVLDCQDLPANLVYFDYHDGIAQPHIAGNPFAERPDGGQPPVDPGGFLLGMGTQPPWTNIPVPTPAQFGMRGTFAAFRIMRQHLDAFESFLVAQLPAFKQLYYPFFADTPEGDRVARDALKAMLVGRWPNGTPLAVFPVTSGAPAPVLPEHVLNDFTYPVPAAVGGCPFGSHIRRANPRDAQNPALPHRIMRRAMPYQIPYCPTDRYSGEVGLMGLFLCASLGQQFDFVLGQWVNSQAPESPSQNFDQADPVIGNHPSGDAIVVTLDDSGALTIANFTQTVGSAYVFLPSVPSIQWVAAGCPPV